MKSHPIQFQLPKAEPNLGSKIGTQATSTVARGMIEIQATQPWIIDPYSDQAISGFSKVL